MYERLPQRQIIYGEGRDFLFDHQDVFCVNCNSFDVLYIGNQNVLSLNLDVKEECTIAVRALLILSMPSFISNVM
jgi:hypothetical protein